MTSAHLIQWIEHPETLDKDSLYELRTLMARYPYFQTLRLLYLKNLYLLHDTSFGDELRKSVLYVADRRKLFYQIEGDRYLLHPHQPSVVAGTDADDSGTDRTLYLIDSFLSTVPDEQGQAADLDYAMDYTAYLQSEEAEAEAVAASPVAQAPLLRGQDLIDNFLSRTEEPLLSLEDEIGASAAAVAAERDLNTAESAESERDISPDDALADASLCDALPAQPQPSATLTESAVPVDNPETPSLEEPVSAGETTDATLQVTDEDAGDDDSLESDEIPSEEETFTETLAKIYIKQHRYDKALEIIKKLSLNYPKKNAYFADQIRFLEKLIINAKSK